MSKHISRKDRWTRQDARRYSSALGEVSYGPDGWYALLAYRMMLPPDGPSGLPSWTPHRQRLGPFKRSRNAMVALEREAAALSNRHGETILIGTQQGGD